MIESLKYQSVLDNMLFCEEYWGVYFPLGIPHLETDYGPSLVPKCSHKTPYGFYGLPEKIHCFSQFIIWYILGY